MSEENGDAYLSPYIPDGWQLKATIPAVEGRWSAVTFRYRPMSADEESEVWAKSRLAPAEPMTRFYADVMAAKIVGWDLKAPDGKPLPITADTIKRLCPPFYDALKSYVDGTATGEQEKNS